MATYPLKMVKRLFSTSSMMMKSEGWELPLIVSPDLQERIQSLSSHANQPSPPPKLPRRNRSKDLYACLQNKPYRNILQQSNPVSRQITNINHSTVFASPKSAAKKSLKRRKKSQIFTTPIPISKPQGLMILAYCEL